MDHFPSGAPTFVSAFATDYNALTLSDSEGSAHDSVSRTGTAALQYDFARRGTYWIPADTGSFVSVIRRSLGRGKLLCFGLAATPSQES